VLATGSAEMDDIVIAVCDRTHIERQRRAWPFLRDRRIDSYEGLSSRWLDAPATGPHPSPRTDP
jgi:N-carbamoylputrescine amidase